MAITVFEHENYAGASKRIDFGAYRNLRFPEKDWGDDIDSLRTDPGTWVMAFEDENFEDTFIVIPPNTSYPKLDELGIGDDIDSMIVQDHPFGIAEVLSMLAPSYVIERPGGGPCKKCPCEAFDPPSGELDCGCGHSAFDHKQ